MQSSSSDRFKVMSEHTGWRIVSSEAVMQNLVLAVAAAAASRAGLDLKKSPSYMPMTREVQLKISGAAPQNCDALVDEIRDKTGLVCRIIKG